MIRNRAFLVPEVVQTSAMDCGPAALKCLLEGFGTPLGYERLREACQTSVDGTSIDTLEDLAVRLGQDAEQIMIPADHLFLAEGEALPAIVVVRLPNGFTHFVVLWRAHGPLAQVMDPAVGRRWLSRRRFLRELYIHTTTVPASAWREWAGTEAFMRPLERRLRNLRVPDGGDAAARALEDPGWKGLARLDASVRLADALVASGGLARGAEAAALVGALGSGPEGEAAAIPPAYWFVRAGADGGGEPELSMTGALLVRVRPKAGAAAPGPAAREDLPADLKAALDEPPARPLRKLAALAFADGRLAPVALAGSILVAGLAVLFEAVFFRSLLDLGRDLRLGDQRLAAIGVLVAFLFALVGVETSITSGVLWVGVRLEARLRMAFLEKLPRLGDRYFRSRLASDMAQRAHSVATLGRLPETGHFVARNALTLLFMAAGITWLDARVGGLAFLSAGLTFAILLGTFPLLRERDMRLRSHTAALSQVYLDGFLGLVPIRSHGAERALRREHDDLLTRWLGAGLSFQRVVVVQELLLGVAGFGLAAAIVVRHLAAGPNPGSVLLLAYWAVNIPLVSFDLATAFRQLPAARNIALRLLEPLGARDDDAPQVEALATAPEGADMPRSAAEAGGARVDLEGVAVVAAGHVILDGIDLALEPGAHVAVVGRSGAGKTTLLGLLLGFHPPARGRVLVDGAPLAGAPLARLLAETAWLDPEVRLWNRSLLDNVLFGAPDGDLARATEAIGRADLGDLVTKLPDGLQTSLGEGGGLVSGGEGQRVRFGRALTRDARLALLDEPFRGLPREKRRELLARARESWAMATLLCVTHDVDDVAAFPRVLVVDGGRIVEDGNPAALLADPGSRLSAMLAELRLVEKSVARTAGWRRLALDGGRITEAP